MADFIRDDARAQTACSATVEPMAWGHLRSMVWLTNWAAWDARRPELETVELLDDLHLLGA